MAKAKERASGLDQNVSVLVGEITTEIVVRELSNGHVTTSFDVTTDSPHGRFVAPVVISGDPDGLEIGQRVLVCGVTRRRFFRTGTGVTSRTELLAHVVLPVRRKAQVSRIIYEVIANLKDVVSV